jgi:type IV secretory pathway VirB2 component (pilin)
VLQHLTCLLFNKERICQMRYEILQTVEERAVKEYLSENPNIGLVHNNPLDLNSPRYRFEKRPTNLSSVVMLLQFDNEQGKPDYSQASELLNRFSEYITLGLDSSVVLFLIVVVCAFYAFASGKLIKFFKIVPFLVLAIFAPKIMLSLATILGR